MLELIEASLNQVTLLVGTTIVAVFAPPVGSWRDHGLHAFDELGGTADVCRLTGCKKEAQWAAFAIRDQVDLGGQSSSGTPQSLIAAPPFPVAACW